MLPKSVTVGTYKYDVRSDQDAQVALSEAGLVGQTKHTEQVLLLNTKQHADQIMDTLLHEVLHVVFSQAGYGVSEKLILRITPVLLGVLRNNPKPIEALTA